MGFRDKLTRGEFVITGEVAPPRGISVEKMVASIDTFAPHVDAVNITDNQGATLHLSSLAASQIALGRGVDPVFQQTCRDRNRLALQSDLLAAASYGLENLLCVTGDASKFGDHPEAKPVFDLDSTQLIAVAKALNAGTDMNGVALDGEPTNFYIGAAAFPEAEPWELQKRRIAQKIEAGAKFFQTQAMMDNELFASRVEEIKALGAKVIVGVILLKNSRVVNFINNNLAGVAVHPSHVKRIADSQDPLATATEIAVEQACIAHEVADGIHIMPLGSDKIGVEILKRAGISKENPKRTR